jgi:hypothetical protein
MPVLRVENKPKRTLGDMQTLRMAVIYRCRPPSPCRRNMFRRTGVE